MAPGRASCQGSPSFEPDAFFKQWEAGKISSPDAQANDLRKAICQSFALPTNDTYVYRATASVTLSQVQQAVNAGDKNGLHAWYPDVAFPPTAADVDAYTSIFASSTSTERSLKAFAANAKKSSVRARVAENLTSKRSFPSTVSVPKLKKHTNPYIDFWAWSCKALEWCGPEEATSNVKQSHHVLPVLYHHFGCVCPSFEALEVINKYAAGRPIIDAGSGNGYWTYMLRRHGLEVVAVDNDDSVWRTTWIGDTFKTDAAGFIQRQEKGATDCLLLLVYPQVTTDFTKETIAAYKGDTIIVAGTQNTNDFTANVDDILQSAGGWEKTVQTPLPSFPGKDEALYVWEKQAV